MTKEGLIEISYEYKWKSTIEDEGILIITNNANYPEIRAAYAKVASQGGKEKIMVQVKDDMEKFGHWAQIGKNVHISGGAGIGGVLEPVQAGPVIIEDDCFIGARSEVAEGVVVETGAVLSMGVFIGASTKVIDRNTGEIYIGRVPAYSVVVPGSLPGKLTSDGSQGPSLYCAVIVKKVDAQTRSKTSVNELLRD